MNSWTGTQTAKVKHMKRMVLNHNIPTIYLLKNKYVGKNDKHTFHFVFLTCSIPMYCKLIRLAANSCSWISLPGGRCQGCQGSGAKTMNRSHLSTNAGMLSTAEAASDSFRDGYMMHVMKISDVTVLEVTSPKWMVEIVEKIYSQMLGWHSNDHHCPVLFEFH